MLVLTNWKRFKARRPIVKLGSSVACALGTGRLQVGNGGMPMGNPLCRHCSLNGLMLCSSSTSHLSAPSPNQNALSSRIALSLFTIKPQMPPATIRKLRELSVPHFVSIPHHSVHSASCWFLTLWKSILNWVISPMTVIRQNRSDGNLYWDWECVRLPLRLRVHPDSPSGF